MGEAVPYMDGTIGSGLMLAAILGLAREYPEMYELLNTRGDAVAYNLRNQCSLFHTFAGFSRVRIDALTNVPDPIRDPRVQRALRDTRLGINPDRPGEVPERPVLLFSADRDVPVGPFPGRGDQYFPEQRLKDLRAEWCEAGANVDYVGVPGEHVTGMFTAPGPVFDWLDRRFAERAGGAPERQAC